MAAAWRTVRVFISSTFKDMQAERDHLVRFVFPRLREELLRRRMHFVDVDLRWGVTSEQDAQQVCREIIDECRPRFLCMLGGRYGWTPPGGDRSITADEVHYAALRQGQPDQRRFFYFRDPAATAAMVEDHPGEYREPPGSETERRLEALKQAIQGAGYKPFVYPAQWNAEQGRLVGLEEFGRRVYDDLLASINGEFGTEAPEPVDEFAEEMARQEVFVSERTARYVVGSRQPVLDRVAEFASTDGEPSILAVTGAPGSGKSALLGKVYQGLTAAHPDWLVVPHFVGASAGSTDLRQSLRRLCHEIQRATSDDEPLPESVDELVTRLPMLLEQAASTRRVVLVIDGLDQMDATDGAHTLRWLPYRLAQNARMVVSSLAHPVLDALRLRREQVVEFELAPLTSADAGAIAEGFAARYRKRLSEEQLEALLAKPESGSPLYLLVALEELRTLGTYEEITARIEQLPGQVRELFLWILRERLSTDPGFQDAQGNLVGAELVRKCVSHLGVSRHGLSHAELVGTVDPGDPRGNVAALERLLRPYLMRRGELLDFYHGQLREAVECEYLDEEHEAPTAHRALATYFAAQGYGDCRMLAETPYHLMQAGEHAELESLLTDLSFVEAKCKAGMAYGLLVDYRSALQALPPAHAASARPFGAFMEQRYAHIQQMMSTLPLDRAAPIHQLAANWPKNDAVRTAGREEASRLAGRLWTHVMPVFSPDQKEEDVVLAKSGGPWRRVAMDRAGRVAIAGAEDGSVFVWDLTTRSLRHRMRGHSQPVSAVAVSWDGRIGTSAGGHQWITLYDGAQLFFAGSYMRSYDGKENEAYSPCPGEIVVWDMNTGQRLGVLAGHRDWITDLCVSPDASLAASVSMDGTARVWDLHSYACILVLAPPQGGEEEGTESADLWRRPLNAISISPDGTTLVAGGGDYYGHALDHCDVLVWSIPSGALRHHHRDVFRSVVSRIAVTDDSRWALAISRGCEGEYWQLPGVKPRAAAINLESGEIARLECRFPPILTDVCVAEGAGCWIATGGVGGKRTSDGVAQKWNMAGDELLAVSSDHQMLVTGCATTPAARPILTTGLDGTVRVWRPETSRARSESEEPDEEEASCITVSHDGSLVITGHKDGRICFWDGETGQPLNSYQAHVLPVFAALPTSDGKRLVTASVNERICSWHLGQRRLECRISAECSSVALVSNDEVVAVGDNRGGIALYDLETGATRHTWHAHEHKVTSLSAATDGSKLVSTSVDGTIAVWDSHDGREMRRMAARGHTPMRAVLAPNEFLLVSIATGFDVCYFVPKSAELVTQLQYPLRDAFFSADATRLISVHRPFSSNVERCYVMVEDLVSGTKLYLLDRFEKGVEGVQLTRDERYLIVCSVGDGEMMFFDFDTGELVATAPFFEPSHVVACSRMTPKGKIAMAFRSGRIQIHELKGGVVAPPRVACVACHDGPRGSADTYTCRCCLCGSPQNRSNVDQPTITTCRRCGMEMEVINPYRGDPRLAMLGLSWESPPYLRAPEAVPRPPIFRSLFGKDDD